MCTIVGPGTPSEQPGPGNLYRLPPSTECQSVCSNLRNVTGHFWNRRAAVGVVARLQVRLQAGLQSVFCYLLSQFQAVSF